MIKLNIDKWCENCDEFEPEVERDLEYCQDFRMNDTIGEVTTKVTCVHRQRCKSIRDYIQKEVERLKQK